MNFNKVKKIFFMFGIILINLSTKVYATDFDGVVVPPIVDPPIVDPPWWYEFVEGVSPLLPEIIYLCIFIIYAIVVGVIIKNNKLSNIKKIVLSISILIIIFVIHYIVINYLV